MNTVASTLGDRLRLVRGQLSQDEFATRFGVHKNTIGKYERGERHPDSEYLLAIRTKFSVDLDWLVTGEGEMRPGEAKATMLPTREASSAEINLDIQGQISELISDVYRECGVPVTLRQLVAEAGRIAQDVSGPDYTDADRPGAIRYAVAQLRRQLLVANTPAASSKSSA